MRSQGGDGMNEQREEIVTALRELIAQVHSRCYGAYGAGDEGYQGEYEEAIQATARAIAGAK